MGYVTYYRLKIDVPDGAPEACPKGHPRRAPDDQFCPTCGARFGESKTPFAAEDVADGLTVSDVADGNSCKWYEHEEDMAKFSAAHPGVLFTLDGEGEEAGDVWRKYFRDGLVQRWRLPTPEPDPFDPTKLGPPETT